MSAITSSRFAHCAPGTHGHFLLQQFIELERQGYYVESLGDECDTPLYAFCDLESDIENRRYRRSPNVIWEFSIPGYPGARMVIKPVFERLTDFIKRYEQHDPEFVEAVTSRHKGTHIFSHRHNVTLITADRRWCHGFADHTHQYVAMRGGREGAAMARDFYYAFEADQWKVMALESDNCCLCGRRLTDPESRSLGIGPECRRVFATDGSARP